MYMSLTRYSRMRVLSGLAVLRMALSADTSLAMMASSSVFVLHSPADTQI